MDAADYGGPGGVPTLHLMPGARRIRLSSVTTGSPSSPLWSATFGDSALENETSLVASAAKSFQPQQIVLSHANLPTITHCYAQLTALIRSRNPQTVTLTTFSVAEWQRWRAAITFCQNVSGHFTAYGRAGPGRRASHPCRPPFA